MPRKPDPKQRVSSALDAAVDAEVERMLSALHEGQVDRSRKRILDLLLRNDLSDDERREFKSLARWWRKDRRQSRRFAERSTEARARWAAFSAEKRAKWDRRAADSHRRYDRTGSRPALPGEELYWLHFVTEEKKQARRRAREEARRTANEQAERTAYDERMRVAQAARETPQLPSAPMAVPEPASTPRPRRRLKVGVVALYDAEGHRVDLDEEDDEW